MSRKAIQEFRLSVDVGIAWMEDEGEITALEQVQRRLVEQRLRGMEKELEEWLIRQIKEDRRLLRSGTASKESTE